MIARSCQGHMHRRVSGAGLLLVSMSLSTMPADVAHGQCAVQQIGAPAGEPTGGFARAIAVHGNRMAVAGEPDANDNSTISIYLFDEVTGLALPDPIQQFSVDLEATPDVRGFGQSIAMTADGCVVVGALDPDSDNDCLPYIEYRRWDHDLQLFDGFPTRWDPGEYSPSSTVACETIVAKMGRVELARAMRGGGGVLRDRIMLGGMRDGEVPGTSTVEGFVLDVVGDTIQPRGVITRDTERGSAVWTSPPDNNTAAALFWDPFGPDLGPRLTVFQLNGDLLEEAADVESSMPTNGVADFSGDGRPDIVVVGGIVDPDSDGDGIFEARIFRRNDQIWSETDTLSSGIENNPLYEEMSPMVTNPVYNGRALGPMQVFILAKTSSESSADIDAHVWEVEGESAAKKVAKFKAGAELAKKVNIAPGGGDSGTGGGGAGGRVILAMSCDCCDDDCDGIVSVIEVNGNDCNGNGVCDDLDIATGVSSDADFNGVPDECEQPVVDLPFGGLVTNPIGLAPVTYNAGRDRIEVWGVTNTGDDGISTHLGGLPGFAAQQRILSFEIPDAPEGTIHVELTPAPGVNALPISMTLPQIGDEVLCQLDTSNMGDASHIIVHGLSGDGSVLISQMIEPPYPASLARVTMPNLLPAVEGWSAGPRGGEVDASTPHLYLGVSLRSDGEASINGGEPVSGVRGLLIELHPDTTDGPLGALADNPLYEESKSTGENPLFGADRGLSQFGMTIEKQAGILRGLAVSGAGEALLSGMGEAMPGSLLVSNLGSSGQDGVRAAPDPLLSAGETLRDNLEFSMDVTSSPLRGGGSPQLDVLAEAADGTDVGYSIVMTASNMRDIRALMPAGGPLQASIDVLVDGDVVRSFEGVITDDIIATVLFIDDWPVSARIGARAGSILTGRVTLSEPLAILIPGREFFDQGDAIQFELSPAAPSRGEGGVDGIREASLRGRDLEQIIVHDIAVGEDVIYCDGDDNQDGIVDLADLLAVIGNWGSAGPSGDVDGSGVVDLADLLMVIGNWGCTSE